MDVKIKTEWLEALRSGRFKQACGYLKGNGGFCCHVFATFIVDELSVHRGDTPHEWRAHNVDVSCVAEVLPVSSEPSSFEVTQLLADVMSAIRRVA